MSPWGIYLRRYLSLGIFMLKTLFLKCPLDRWAYAFLLRSDNGLVFTSRSYTKLVKSYGLQQEFITPHCPEQNGLVKRVIRSLKEQCVHRQRFETLQHASRVIGDWMYFYNNQRPHQALKMKTPSQKFEELKLAAYPVQKPVGHYSLEY